MILLSHNYILEILYVTNGVCNCFIASLINFKPFFHIYYFTLGGERQPKVYPYVCPYYDSTMEP